MMTSKKRLEAESRGEKPDKHLVISHEVHKEVKIHAIRREVSPSEIAEIAIREWLEREAKR